MNLDREQIIAISALFVLLAACIITPLLFLSARSNTAAALADAQGMLRRLERAHRLTHDNHRRAEEAAAPETAFLNAQMPGLASAELESYIVRLAASQQASLISSGVDQAEAPDQRGAIRIQAILNIPYAKLQAFLFKLETGTPYVFVDTMTLQSAGDMARPMTYESTMKVTLGLRALGREGKS